MRERSGAKRRKVRGKQTNTQFANRQGDVVPETADWQPNGGFRLDVLSTPTGEN
jgi:hypothetical protein